MKRISLLLTAALLGATLAAAGISVAQAGAAGKHHGGGYVKRCGGGKIFLKAKERRTFLLHNRVRRRHHLKTFCLNPRLERAARAHSRAMIRHDFFAHGDVGRRLHRFGYHWRRYGENIAWGQRYKGRPRNRMRAWMHSPHHRHNILDRRLHEIGIGIYPGTYRRYHHVTMYTVDLGTRF